MKNGTLWAISIIIDIAVIIGAVIIVSMIWPDDSWHKFVYYICGTSFGGYAVFRYKQLKELLQ